MTVHLISVGISLADFFSTATDEERWGGYITEAQKIEEFWDKDRLGLAPAASTRTEADLLHAAFALDAGVDLPRFNALSFLQTLADEVRPETWTTRRGLSAELDTILAHGLRRIVDTDLTVLLCSDTPKGRACGIWTAISLAGGDVGRVLYLDGIDVDTHLERPENGRIVVVNIPGLDATKDSEFHTSMKAVGHLGRLLIGHDDRPALIGAKEPVWFHLTGGYRATIPYLIAAAEWLRSLGHDAQAHVLPEKAEGTVPIPLRRLRPDWVHSELAGFDSRGLSDSRPEDGLLEGYAYELRGNGSALTSFGMGMRVFFNIAAGPESPL